MKWTNIKRIINFVWLVLFLALLITGAWFKALIFGGIWVAGYYIKKYLLPSGL